MQIIIVGAGPIGCYLGQLLTQAGFSITLLEEHSQIGFPQHCAGLVGASFFEDSRVPLPQTIVHKQLNSAAIEYGQHRFTLNRYAAAYLIDRVALEQKLAQGLSIQKSTQVTGLKRSGSDWSLLTSRGEFKSRIVIGADGASSTIRRLAQFKLQPFYYHGVQFRIKKEIANTNRVRVRFTKPFLDFCWAFSENGEVLRVGSISTQDARGKLLQFLQDTALTGPIIEQISGIIPVGYGQTSMDGIALVGDAACQVKPLSGGGLYYGMRCAEILADCLRTDNLSQYENRWKKKIGREIKQSLRIRNYLNKRTPAFLERLFMLAEKHKDMIEQSALFEEHSVSFFQIARRVSISLPGLYMGNSIRRIARNKRRT